MRKASGALQDFPVVVGLCNPWHLSSIERAIHFEGLNCFAIERYLVNGVRSEETHGPCISEAGSIDRRGSRRLQGGVWRGLEEFVQDGQYFVLVSFELGREGFEVGAFTLDEWD